MTANMQRADPPAHPMREAVAGLSNQDDSSFDAGFDSVQWQESTAERELKGAGGRAILAGALIGIAILWVGYCAWAAGRALGELPLSSPILAQWVALAAGPLALLGLAWIMFGRTRRKETERFTQSVIAMRAEARSLEALLAVLSQRLGDSKAELSAMTQQLMTLGDEATGRFGGMTRELDSSAQAIVHHGQLFDRAAESARNDIAVLLDDLPRAEATARAMAERLRGAGSEAASQAANFEEQIGRLNAETAKAGSSVAEASQRLVSHLTHIESAGAAAAARIGEAESNLASAVDALMGRTAEALDSIRTGIDTHSLSVAALVEQASAGIGRTGVEATETLAASIGNANRALDGFAARLAEQESASQRILTESAQVLARLSVDFDALAEQGDARAAAFVTALGRARDELAALGEQGVAQDGALDELGNRTNALRATVEQLTTAVRDQLANAVLETETGAARLLQSAQSARPEIEWMRDAALEASARLSSSSGEIANQQDQLSALLATIDEGVDGAGGKLAALAGQIAEAQAEASQLSAETGPALVAAMVQVREAAAHAAERAREAIAAIVPESAEKLSGDVRSALERAVREGIEERLSEVDAIAARAVDAARSASDRLAQQMLSLGQSAAALEQHIEETSVAQRERDSEAFARRVALLIDSMHSAAIDVGKILSDEVDEKAWESYLKGNRGVFTRRAVRLLDGGEAKGIRSHYDADGEFQQSVNRYVHDFEAMLRRVLAERDGGMIAVTLMSSDMGKLYAALAEAIERRR